MVRFKDVQCYIFIRVRSRDIINDKVTAHTRTRSHVVGGRFSWQESGGGKRKQNNINHPPLRFQWLSSFPLSFPRSFFLFTRIHVCLHVCVRAAEFTTNVSVRSAVAKKLSSSSSSSSQSHVHPGLLFNNYRSVFFVPVLTSALMYTSRIDVIYN